MYTSLYRYARLALPRGRALHRNLKELLHTQWLSPEEIAGIQLAKIKHLVKHAFTNVPFYRQRFREIGLHPNDIKTLDDFRQIPALTREDIKRAPELFVATNYPRQALKPGATGGSTGEPLKFYQTAEWGHSNWATIQRNRTWFGFQEGCKQAWIWGREEDLPSFQGDLLSFRLEQFKAWLRRQKWLNSFDMSEDKMQAFAETLALFQPEFIFGYTSSLWVFAQYLKKNGITDIRPKAVQGGADMLYDFQRELIEEVFGCPMINHYATMELGIIGAECLERRLHVAAETRYLEMINGGQPAEPGETGEVVATDLTNFAMPFIRYKNGDLASLEDQPCPCGRGLPVLRELMGRKSDFFTTPEGKLISGLYFVHRLRGWPGVRKYRVHQSSIDKIEILFEAGDDLDKGWVESRRQEFQAHVGESVKLSFKRVDHIPLTRVGKHLFTTSAVPLDLSTKKDLGTFQE